MGHYIQVPNDKRKAEQIVQLYGAVEIPQPVGFAQIPLGKALICVIGNGPFEAAGYIYSESEFRAANSPHDRRPRQWLLIDEALARELTGFAAVATVPHGASNPRLWNRKRVYTFMLNWLAITVLAVALSTWVWYPLLSAGDEHPVARNAYEIIAMSLAGVIMMEIVLAILAGVFWVIRRAILEGTRK